MITRSRGVNCAHSILTTISLVLEVGGTADTLLAAETAHPQGPRTITLLGRDAADD